MPQHHPDVAKESSETAHLHFVNITEAYEFILQLVSAAPWLQSYTANRSQSRAASQHPLRITQPRCAVRQTSQMRAKKEGIEGQKPGNTEAWHEW